ncbi:MAG: PAS domain S-box protein [Terracidiphilus sp.]|jgi:PAS domain S-box-containing protein
MKTTAPGISNLKEEAVCTVVEIPSAVDPVENLSEQTVTQQAITQQVCETPDAPVNGEIDDTVNESQDRLRALFEGVQTGIFIIDPLTHMLVDTNSVAAKMVGIPRDKIVGSLCHKFVCPAEKGRCPVTDLGQTVDNSERVLLTAGGERRAIIKTVRRVMVAGREQLLESFLDITERKHAEEELLFKTTLLETEAETTIDGILVVDPKGRKLQSNRRFAEIFNIPSELLDGGDDGPMLQYVQTQIRNPASFLERIQYLNAHTSEKARDEVTFEDGRCIDRYSAPLLDASGRYYGRIWYFRDITDRKQAEQALRDNEQRYRELFENASEIIFTTDLDGRFTSLNLAGQQAFGYSQEEVAGTDIWRTTAPESWDVLKRDRSQTAAGEAELTSEIEVTAKDGRRVRLEVKPRIIRHGDKPVGIQAIARDITGRDIAEMELRQAQKLESVGRLASGIAHEINTPIQFVGDNIRFLEDSFAGLKTLLGKFGELREAVSLGAVKPDLLREVQRVEAESDVVYLLEEIPRAIAQTTEGVDRVATIVRAMKEFAHPESREMALADLNQAIHSTVTVARNEWKYVAEVETDFGDLPLVVCNVGDLNQVFLNLLVNAAHAIADAVKDGEKGRITIRSAAEDDRVHVSITDTGKGIPEDIRTKIFDPFFTTKEVGRGTGQGLAIARSVIVDRHKGSLTFESEVGKGTTFHIRLPITKEDDLPEG